LIRFVWRRGDPARPEKVLTATAALEDARRGG
jgi:hypothetical protein